VKDTNEVTTTALETSTPAEGMSQAVNEFVYVYQCGLLSSDNRAATLGEYITKSRLDSGILEWIEDDLPLQVELERSFRRFTEYWRARVEHGPSPIHKRDRRSAAAKARNKAILGEVGIDPTAIAFYYGLTSEGVRKIRTNAGRDPDNGLETQKTREERIDGKVINPKPLTSR
jgi:hypothetical protein